MGPHSKPSSKKDHKLIIEQLREDNIFQQLSRRRSTIKIVNCLLDSFPKEDTEQWIYENVIPSLFFK